MNEDNELTIDDLPSYKDDRVFDKYGNTTFSFKKPLDPNWEYTFGKAEECISFRAHYETPPNRLQRWLCGKILGMRWKEL